MSNDCMIPSSDEFRLNELDLLIETDKVKLHVMRLREKSLCDHIEKLGAERKALCPHVITEETSKYSGGGYDYMGRTFYKITCKRCNTVLETWDESDGCYG
jgi:hypothetical protein